MKTIWKTVLAPSDKQTILIPAGAEILMVREQGDWICVWYLCESEAALESRQIVIVGTGHQAPGDAWRYIGSASLSDGKFIFHVFEFEGWHQLALDHDLAGSPGT